MAIDICGENAIDFVLNTCDACEELESRVSALEARLNGKVDVELSIVDANDRETTATVLGHVE